MNKNKKKEVKKQVEQNERELFLKSLPITVDQLSELFDYLDIKIIRQGCSHTMAFTKAFLAENKFPEKETILWLNSQGGHCDCEVLANVEQKL